MSRILRQLAAAIVLLLPMEPTIAQWTLKRDDNSGRRCIAFLDSRIFIGGTLGILFTTDQGMSWGSANAGLPEYPNVQALVLRGPILFAGLGFGYGGVYRSTDSGANWTPISDSLPASYVNSLLVSDGVLFAGTFNGVYLTTDNGAQWVRSDSGMPANRLVLSLAQMDTNIFASTAFLATPPHGVKYLMDPRIYRSTNRGTSWEPINNGLPFASGMPESVPVLAIAGRSLLASTRYNGVYLSTNAGDNWNLVFSNIDLTSCLTDAGHLFLGNSSGEVLLFEPAGPALISLGVPNGGPVHALGSDGTYLYAIADNAVFSRPMSDIISTVELSEAETEDGIDLEQNYPNPFNPNTTLRFSIPSKSYVRVEILDVLGRKVVDLVNDELSAGVHTRDWNASQIASGIYFCRLRVGAITRAIKLLLLR